MAGVTTGVTKIVDELVLVVAYVYPDDKSEPVIAGVTTGYIKLVVVA